MREILFRGKRKDNREWIEGFFAQSRGKTYIIKDNSMKEVFPETAGEFTGVYAKNDIEVFDGDIIILDYPDDEIYTVIPEDFDERCFDAISDTGCYGMNELDDYDMEVIGNVHDNPELLTESLKEVWDEYLENLRAHYRALAGGN